MKTEQSFRQLATAFLAAGAPGASEEQRSEASISPRDYPSDYPSSI
jgi:hypothetical protein